MNKTIKKKWLKALRSGEYKQGRVNLYWNGRYCCLGVLRKIEYPRSKSSSADAGVYLTGKHLESFGLTHEQQLFLSQMNDRDLKSFKQIANWIDKNL